MSRPASGLSPRRRQYLRALGIPVWRERGAVAEAPSSTVAAGAVSVTAGEAGAWQQLEQEVANCTKCELYQSRTQAVFGVGNRRAEWMVIGEAPGKDEDAQGEPFVGRAGKLLNAMLEAMGFAREDVYIANILKSRPPKNRDPKPAEVAACEPYLQRQIALINPKIMLAIGRVAAQNLLKVDTPIGKLRGQRLAYAVSEVGRIPVVVTYHPAYLLRSPQDKRKAWQDLLLAQQVYEESRQQAGAA